MDLEDMGADERAAVETLAWSVKELISEIAAAGMPALKQRIESALGGDVAGERFTRLAALVPADTVRAFRDEGFPGLADEIARRRRGESVPIPGQAAGAATKAPAPESAASDEDDSILDDEDELLDDEDDSILDDDEDSILDAGDALGDEDETAGEDAEVAPAALSAEGEAWAEAGGWYREDFTLRYRPSGHADGFVRAWLDLKRKRRGRAGRRGGREHLRRSRRPRITRKLRQVPQRRRERRRNPDGQLARPAPGTGFQALHRVLAYGAFLASRRERLRLVPCPGPGRGHCVRLRRP